MGLGKNFLKKINPIAVIKSKKKSLLRAKAIASHLSFQMVSKHIVDREYKKMWKNTDRLLDGTYASKDAKYWRKRIIGEYYGKFIKGTPAPEVQTAKKYLQEMVTRIDSESINQKDKKWLKTVFIPYWKSRAENNYAAEQQTQHELLQVKKEHILQ